MVGGDISCDLTHFLLCPSIEKFFKLIEYSGYMKKRVLLVLLLLTIAGCTEPVEEIPVVETEEIKEPIVEKDKVEEVKEQIKEETPEVEVADESQIAEEAPEQVTVDTSLLAHYTFDTDATDSAHEYHGALHGGATIQEGKRGNALYLDGIDDYVEFPETALTDVGSLSQGTISFWFHYESLLDQQTVMPIFYIGNKQDSPDNMFVIEIGHSAGDGRTDDPDPSDRRIYSTWIKDNREPFLCFDSGTNMEENTWHQYTVVVGPNGNHGYINGILMENTDHNFGSTEEQYFLDSIPNKETFLLGYGRNSFMISPEFVYYKGMIDDLRIYDRPLEWIEVQELYASG
jgi:hypothetical protein